MQRLLSPRHPISHKGFPHRVDRRGLVPRNVLDALKRLPWYPVVVDHCIPQPWGKCISHSDRMQDLMIRSLCWRGLLDLTPQAGGGPRDPATLPTDNLGRIAPYASPTPCPQAEALPQPPWMWIEEDPSAERIVELVKAHGPATLTMAEALGPSQGAHIYDEHHALVVLHTFRHKGRPVAIAVDGNNLQDNELMDRLREQAHRLGLTAEELSVGEYQDTQRHLPPHLDINQLGLRLIDLESMAQASSAKRASRSTTAAGFPNTVRWATNARVIGNPFPPDVEDALLALCDASPDLIERPGDPAPASIRLDE
jgi:hypothetical protein